MKEPLATKIKPELKKALKDLSEKTRIPQARLIEEALELLLKHHNKEEPYV